MTRLLIVPNPNTLIWLDLTDDPTSLVEDILRGDWHPPAPYDRMAGLTGSLKAYWQDGLVIVCGRELTSTDGVKQPTFSRRQREVLKGLVEGLSSRQIALRLGIEARTVYHHVAQLKGILSAASRAELVHKARGMLK